MDKFDLSTSRRHESNQFLIWLQIKDSALNFTFIISLKTGLPYLIFLEKWEMSAVTIRDNFKKEISAISKLQFLS